jgi:hypothetical protein
VPAVEPAEPRVVLELLVLRLEVLPDLAAAGLFGAVRFALLLAPPPDPFDPLAERAEAEPAPNELAELPVVPDEPEAGCGRAAGLGGCGATGIEKRESSATRNHSLRPDAL